MFYYADTVIHRSTGSALNRYCDFATGRAAFLCWTVLLLLLCSGSAGVVVSPRGVF